MISGLGITIMLRIAIALEKAETLWIILGKKPSGDSADRRQRVPLLCADCAFDEQSIRVVHFRSPIVRRTRLMFAAPEHAGERRKPEHLDRFAKKNTRFHFDG